MINAYRKYCIQRQGAQSRGIEWAISFDDWLRIWIDSGQSDNRGTRRGQYVMGRYGDRGPYAIGNVYICLSSTNVTHAADNMRDARQRKLAMARKRIDALLDARGKTTAAQRQARRKSKQRGAL